MRFRFGTLILYILLFNSAILAQTIDHDSLSNVFIKSTTSGTLKPWTISESIKTINITPQEIDPFDHDLNYPMLLGLGAVYLSGGIAVHIYQTDAWWDGERRSFHITNDWDYARWLDKTGHFWGAYFLEHMFSIGLEAANMDSEESTLYASAAAFLFQMYVEFEDGFAKDWGFSPGDAAADLLGSLYPIGQFYIPYLKNFQFKLSYYPEKAGTTEPDGKEYMIIDDYEGQKFWLAVRMKQVLPESVAEYWPKFLQLAVGMGVRNLDGSGGGYNDFYIALDFDAETIPLYGPFWQMIKNTINYFHLPMPGIRINNGVAFFVLCY